MPDEIWSSSTVGITTGASVGLLQSLGLVRDSGIPGVGAGISLVFANSVDPGNPYIVQFFDAVMPDEVSVMEFVNVEGGIGLGGHLALEAGLYPTHSTADLVQNNTAKISAMAYCYGGVSVDKNDNIVGGSVRIGPGIGIEASASGAPAVLGVSLENGLVLYTSPGSYSFNFWTFQFEKFAPRNPRSSLDVAVSTGWARHDPGEPGGGGSSSAWHDRDATDSTLPGGTPEASDPSVQLPPDTTAPTGGEVWVDPNTGRTNIKGDANHTGHATQAPLILDLDGDGVEVNASAQVSFDWDGDGFLESGNWAVRGRAA